MIILCLQKIIGPKFFIPKSFREHTYEYYKTTEEVKDKLKDVECVICLESLENVGVNNDEDNEYNFKENMNYAEKLAIMIQKWSKRKKNKPYMKTPCNHFFHTKCLETWLELKNECPYCRQKIPPLES